MKSSVTRRIAKIGLAAATVGACLAAMMPNASAATAPVVNYTSSFNGYATSATGTASLTKYTTAGGWPVWQAQAQLNNLPNGGVYDLYLEEVLVDSNGNQTGTTTLAFCRFAVDQYNHGCDGYRQIPTNVSITKSRFVVNSMANGMVAYTAALTSKPAIGTRSTDVLTTLNSNLNNITNGNTASGPATTSLKMVSPTGFYWNVDATLYNLKPGTYKVAVEAADKAYSDGSISTTLYNVCTLNVQTATAQTNCSGNANLPVNTILSKSRLVVIASVNGVTFMMSASYNFTKIATPVTVMPASFTAFTSNNHVGPSGNNAVGIYSNTTGTQTVVFPDATQSLIITAKAQQCAGAPQLTVSVDGATLVATVTSADYTMLYLGPLYTTGGTHTVKVAYLNDYQSSTCDRNVFIDKILFR